MPTNNFNVSSQKTFILFNLLQLTKAVNQESSRSIHHDFKLSSMLKIFK